MGSVLGKDDDVQSNSSGSSSTFIDSIGPTTSGLCNRRCNNSRKRQHQCSAKESAERDETCVKMIKLDTPRYVHKKLFVEGSNSDVKINAMGHVWKLHRVYLEQCEYFRALFQGNWRDSDKNEYTLEVVDKNICFTGLNNVFASLYNNEIEIDREHIAGVVASAAMLNLTSVLTRCSDLLSSYLSEENILLCLQLADTYGFMEKLKEALEFMNRNFWRYCLKTSFLKQLNLYWFSKILASASDTLCVKENEMDLYVAVRNWIYLQYFPEENDVHEKKMREFFASDAFDWYIYVDVLRHLRVSHLTLLVNSMKLLKKDKMIPMKLMDWVVRDQWNTLLLNEEATTPLEQDIGDDFFYRHCFRLGRSELNGIDKTMWRWLGYFFGSDLLMNYFAGSLRFTRNCANVAAQQHISIRMCDIVRIHYRVIVCSEAGQLLLDTQKRCSSLGIDRSVEVGSFKVPKCSFSVHVFYLACIPGPSSTHYWDNYLKEEEARRSLALAPQ